jgi:hypothetical protein
MGKVENGGQQRCTAITEAGRPCRYPAVPGSDPPRCELHGMVWLDDAAPGDRAAYYGRYLAKWQRRGDLAHMDERSLIRELLVARALLDDMLELLRKSEPETAEYKILMPFILRVIKLISDLTKQLGSDKENSHWDQVLDRLGDELDIEI